MSVTLVQCPECNGWLSPRAVFCPTCGAPGPVGSSPRGANSGWRIGWAIVQTFWIAVIATLLGVAFI